MAADALPGAALAPADAALTHRVVDLLAAELGEEHVVEVEPVTTGEDFARFGKLVPAGFLFLGGGGPAPHHHPEFDFDEGVLIHGVRILGSAAVELARDSHG